MAAALAACTLAGCTHTRTLDSATLADVNSRAEQGIATLTLTSGERVQTQALHVAPDVITWMNPEKDTLRSVPAADVVSARFTDRRRGALEGAGLGLAAGVVLGVGVGVFWEFGRGGFSSGDPNRGGLFGGSAGGATGAGLGALLGQGRRSQVVYVLPAPPEH